MELDFHTADLEKATNEQLAELKHRVEAEINRRLAKERTEARKKIRAIAEDYGIDLGELAHEPHRKDAKYRCPDDQFKTWSGIGRKPNWVLEWLAAGKPLSDLEIK